MNKFTDKIPSTSKLRKGETPAVSRLSCNYYLCEEILNKHKRFTKKRYKRKHASSREHRVVTSHR